MINEIAVAVGALDVSIIRKPTVFIGDQTSSLQWQFNKTS